MRDGDFIESALDIYKVIKAGVMRKQPHEVILEEINVRIVEIGGQRTGPLSLRRVPKRFAVPSNFRLRSKELVMAAVGIHGELGTKVPVEFDNVAGAPVPEPSGSPSVTCSDTSIATVQIDTDGSSVDIFPVQPPTKTNTPFTVTYTLGSITFSQDFEITADLTATQGHFVTINDTNIPLPTTGDTPPADGTTQPTP